MRAAVCRRYGPPSDVTVEEVPDPSPGPGEIVVDVAVAAVNYPDALIVGNRYQVSAPLPFTPGSEFAGTVASVGEGVTGVAPGDRVRGSTFVGAFAERVAVAATSVAPVPPGVAVEAAAAYSVVYETAYHSLVSVGRLTAGEWVVVLGAAGGVGSASVQLAHALGARVIAAASTSDKLEVARRMGADVTIDYSREDLKVRIKEVTGGGADLVIDPVGGAYAEPALRALAWGGRFVTVGFASEEIPRIPLNLVLLKGITVTGFEFRGFQTHAPEAAAAGFAEVRRMLAEGQVAPFIGARYPLVDVAAALEDVLERRATGKVLVMIGDGA